MAKSNGIKSLKQAAKLLNKHSPDGESLAYINPEEAKLLRSHGGSGIQTLAGVPSYISLFGWEIPGTSAIDMTGTDILKKFNPYRAPTTDKGEPTYDEKGRVIGAPRSIVGDVLSTWAFFRAKKDKEGLNEQETAEFNRLEAQLSGAKTEFDIGTAGGTELKPGYETDITKSAAYTPIDFSGQDTPELITTATAAEGGRIGAFNGGIQGLMPQQAMPQQGFMPQQGLMPPQGLDPRMGYAAQGGRIGYQDAGSVLSAQQIAQIKQMAGMGSDTSTISSITGATVDQINNVLNPPVESQAYGGRIGYAEGDYITRRPERGRSPAGRSATEVRSLDMDMEWGGPEQVETASLKEKAFEEDPLFASRVMKLEAEHEQDVSNYERRDLIERVMKYIRDAGGSYRVPETSYWKALSAATEAGDEDVAEYLNNFYRKKIGQMDQTMGAAHGGRIGAQGGGIMPLLDMGGMEKDYRQEGGFVPIGRKEKADDVPARLSKNEFVFTADAVKAAGGGDIDEGAQRMYNVMKNLEAGGEISEQSQGQA